MHKIPIWSFEGEMLFEFSKIISYFLKLVGGADFAPTGARGRVGEGEPHRGWQEGADDPE